MREIDQSLRHMINICRSSHIVFVRKAYLTLKVIPYLDCEESSEASYHKQSHLEASEIDAEKQLSDALHKQVQKAVAEEEHQPTVR